VKLNLTPASRYDQLSPVNEQQYKQVCEACDTVLRAPDSSIECAAIPWLHVIREHPLFLNQYEGLFDTPSRYNFMKVLRSAGGWMLHLWRALRHRQAWFGPQTFSQPADVLFISHLLDSSSAGKPVDFYFGDLPEQTRAAGYNVVVAMIDHSGSASSKLADSWSAPSVPRVLLSNSLTFHEEISIWWRFKRESGRLKKRAQSYGPGLLKKVFLQAAVEAMSGSARSTLRLFRQVSQLTDRMKPKVMIVTFEGHAWERIAFAAAREASPGVRCFGYQHSTMFRLQHAIRRKLQARFNPDCVFTSGPVSKMQFLEAPDVGGVTLAVLGSLRSSALKAAHDKAGHAQINPMAFRQPTDSCLVLPEGIVRECEILFRFSIHCARLMPGISFVWRLHPLVKFDGLLAANSDFQNLPANIELSHMTIEEDISRVRWALYRGSSAIVAAASVGVRPVYFDQFDEIRTDPLYQLNQWRKYVSTPADMSAIFDLDSTDSLESQEERAAAIQYCQSLYTPADPLVFFNALNQNEFV